MRVSAMPYKQKKQFSPCPKIENSIALRAEIDAIRLALNQNQPLGNSRFYAKIETMTGQRREAKPRGRPRVEHDESAAHNAGQGKLGL